MILLTGYVAGFLLAVFIAYHQPKIYESTAVVIDGSAPGESTSLSPARAAIAVEEHAMHRRWGTTFEDAIQQVIESVTIEATEEGTVIRVRMSSTQDARLVATSVLEGFEGIERERQTVEAGNVLNHYTSRDIESVRTIRQLRQIILAGLRGTSRQSPGTIVSFDGLLRGEDADLARQCEVYSKLADPPGRFSHPDGCFVVPLVTTETPIEAISAVSPNIDSQLLKGKLAGLFIAGVSLVVIWVRYPSIIAKPIPTPNPAPEWAECESGTRANHPAW
jgi:hypothetical protein